jgi:hypothetical protein
MSTIDRMPISRTVQPASRALIRHTSAAGARKGNGDCSTSRRSDRDNEGIIKQ